MLLFRKVYSEGGTIVGREVPGAAGQTSVPFGSTDHASWIFDWVTDAVASASEPTAGPRYHQIRVLSAAEWQPPVLPAVTIPADDAPAAVEAAMSPCAVWLIQKWPPVLGIMKPGWLARARAEFGKSLSEAAFNRAWSDAAKVHPAMSAKGRRPKPG